MRFDARIPVVLGDLASAVPLDAVIMEGDALPAGRFGLVFRPALHDAAVGCACCAPRGALATAIGEMFVARAKGLVPPFGRVIAATETPGGRHAVVAAVTEDPVCSVRFRISAP